jgi:hypothetical protein
MTSRRERDIGLRPRSAPSRFSADLRRVLETELLKQIRLVRRVGLDTELVMKLSRATAFGSVRTVVAVGSRGWRTAWR